MKKNKIQDAWDKTETAGVDTVLLPNLEYGARPTDDEIVTLRKLAERANHKLNEIQDPAVRDMTAHVIWWDAFSNMAADKAQRLFSRTTSREAAEFYNRGTCKSARGMDREPGQELMNKVEIVLRSMFGYTEKEAHARCIWRGIHYDKTRGPKALW